MVSVACDICGKAYGFRYETLERVSAGSSSLVLCPSAGSLRSRQIFFVPVSSVLTFFHVALCGEPCGPLQTLSWNYKSGGELIFFWCDDGVYKGSGHHSYNHNGMAMR